MNTQTLDSNAMKDKPQFVSNIVTSTLSAFMVIAGIVFSISLMVLLLPFAFLNFYLIKRRFNQMMQSQNSSHQSSIFEQGDIIEGEFTISEETVSEKKDP